jgi:hypothetical protein
MNEVAVRETGEVVALNDPTGGRLVAWAQAAQAANQLAKALAQTSFVPQAFKGNTGDATAAILMGDELGLSPLAALRSIYSVHGTPALYARTMVALVQAHGHEVWTELDTPSKVTVQGRRRGSDKVESSEWTLDRARKAGYTSNKKYETNPQEMLYSKAAATVCRKIGADVLAAIPYSVEDLELEQPAATTTVTRSPERKTTAQRKPATPEPPLTQAGRLDPMPPVHDEPADDGLAEFAPETTRNPVTQTPISKPQLAKLHAIFGEMGITDRDDRLAMVSNLVGRQVESSSDLTKAEAMTLIDQLEAETRPAGETLL